MQNARIILALAGAMVLAGLASVSPVLAQDETAPSTDQISLTDVAWDVIAVGPAPPMTEQSVRFEPDGGLAISTGCATYTGTYQVEGERLRVDEPRRDFGSIEECTFGEQGSANVFLDTLENAETWRSDEDGRLVIDASGGWSLTLAPAAPASGDDSESTGDGLEGTIGTWQLESIDVAMAGETLVLPPDVDITLTLEAEGMLRGDGSCSAYEGRYTIVGADSITLSDVSASPAAECPTELADLQQLYLGILPVVDEVSLVDDRLVLGAAALTADLTYQRAP